MDNKELKRAELTCARVPNDVSEPCAKENTENCERARQPSDRFCRPLGTQPTLEGGSVKKLLVVICSAVLAFGLAGCIGKGKAPVGKGGRIATPA